MSIDYVLLGHLIKVIQTCETYDQLTIAYLYAHNNVRKCTKTCGIYAFIETLKLKNHINEIFNNKMYNVANKG
jgi:hypothetical protein